jgi:hypothetical protein
MPFMRKEPPVPVPQGSKFCFKCSKVHLVEAFAVDNSKWDRRRPCCRSCDVARWSTYYAERMPQEVLQRRRRNWKATKARLETGLKREGSPHA